MRCEHCGSEDLAYERDALLVAAPLRVEDEVLALECSPHTTVLDEVSISCRSCGPEQAGVRWEDWRREQLPAGESMIEDEDAMDAIASYINQPGECQGGDLSSSSVSWCPGPAARSSTAMSEGERAAAPRPLYKTTIVIWSEDRGDQLELEHLAREATSGEAFCSRYRSELVERPERDRDWGQTELFESGGDDERQS